MLVPSKTGAYWHVSLSLKNEVSTHRVHVLVLSSFCGPPPFEGAHAAHNNGDTDDNRLTNLRWATAFENQADVERHGRRTKGVDVYGAVLDENKVINIRERLLADESYQSIAESFGVNKSTIYHIKHRKTWRHVK